MLTNINDIIAEQSCHAQGSIEWFKDRLGCISSSEVHNVMLKPKKGNNIDDEFSDTAKGYLYKKASERNLQKRYIEDDELFDSYIQRVNKPSFAMKYGSEQEGLAREIYNHRLEDNFEVVECGFIRSKDIDMYGDSPDGIVVEKSTGKIVGAIEIKCPNPDTFIRYRSMFRSGLSLKDIQREYYWQCQSHMVCNELQWCDFIFFDEMQKDGFQVVRIKRNEEDIAEMKRRIILANDYINNLLK